MDWQTVEYEEVQRSMGMFRRQLFFDEVEEICENGIETNDEKQIESAAEIG